FAEWTVDDLERTLPVILAQQYGLDSRQVFEIVWRMRVLMTCESGQDMSDKDIESCKAKSLTNVIRVFRGTPDFRGLKDSNGRVLVFPKDLAYLAGKRRVIRDIQRALERGVSVSEFIDNYVETGRIDINTATGKAKELLYRRLFEICLYNN
ncbi:MAG: hypothetical protein QG645_167, partial [Patescibacteria group bacterium]|nr:hypothetical protein [Patescibacteria group bacterium]